MPVSLIAERLLASRKPVPSNSFPNANAGLAIAFGYRRRRGRQALPYTLRVVSWLSRRVPLVKVDIRAHSQKNFSVNLGALLDAFSFSR